MAMKNVAHNHWPAQSNDLFTRVRVAFRSDPTQEYDGLVIRDDMEPPHRTIIQLDDGRVVLGSECVLTFVTVTDELPQPS